MIDVIRMLAAWGADATYGIAVQLAALPLDVGVTRPGAPTLYNETVDDEAAIGLVPKSIVGGANGVLYSTAGGLGLPSPTNCFPDFEIDVLVRVAVSNASAAKNARDSAILMRAVWKNLVAFFLATDNTVRLRNSVQIVSQTSMRWLDLEQKTNDAQAPSGVLVTLRCRDLFTNT